MNEFIDINNLNYLDITIIALIFILSIKGFVNGFLREIFGLLGLIGGIVVASREFSFVAKYIYDKLYPLDNMALLNLLAFIVIVLLIWIGLAIIGIIISSKAHKYRKIGLLSRLLGLIIGGGKYFLLFATIFVSLFNIPFIKDNLVNKIDTNSSKVYPFIKEYGNLVINLDEIKELDIKSSDFMLSKKIEHKVINKRDINKTIKPLKPTINSILVEERGN